MGIEDGAAAREVRKSLELSDSIRRRRLVKRAEMFLSTRRPVDVALSFFVRRIRYEAFALLPRHSFAERNRMQRQKPLWSPGAWQEYFSAAWLLARCPHVHISRACSGVARTPRPRTATTVFPFSDFMLFTVPRSLYTSWQSFSAGGPHSVASELADSQVSSLGGDHSLRGPRP